MYTRVALPVVELALSLEEAAEGGRRALTVDDDRVEIAFPRAVEDGAWIPFRGGIARIRVAPHPRFVREGLDLRSYAVIDLPTAVHGGTVSVPLLKGRTRLKIPPGTRAGQQFRLAGRGLQDEFGRRGDLRVTIEVERPQPLTEEHRAA